MGRNIILAMLLLVVACNEPSPTAPVPRTLGTQLNNAVGLEAIRNRGTLRLLTRNNGWTYFVLRGQPLGFDYEMADRLAKKMGVSLEVIVPSNWGDLIPMLTRGDGDIIAASMGMNETREQQVAFAEPYTLTHMRVVWGNGQSKITNAEELSGKRIHVRSRSSYFMMLTELSALFKRAGRPAIDIVLEGETLETGEILVKVADGKIPYSICDYHICLETAAYTLNLVIGPPVGQPQGLAWAVHHDAPDLLAEVNDFFRSERTKELPNIYKRYYAAPLSQARRKRDALYLDQSGRICAFDGVIRRAAAANGLDWRLLAAIAYQESRFNPQAQTWSGGRGLFGMHPATARKLGLGPLTHPKRAAEAAAKHLSNMRYKFSQVPNDDVRLRLAVAAYQVGVDHVTDARVLTSQSGASPDRWEDVSQALSLLSRRSYAKKAEHGYVPGRTTVRYVEDIWERYRAYRHALGERDVSK